MSVPPLTHEPLTRSIQTWDPNSVVAAESQADTGNMMLAADLCERIMTDDRVKGVLAARTSLVRLPLTFEPGDDRRRSKQAIRALDDGDFWAICPSSELQRLHAWGILLGIGLGRLNWFDELTGKPSVRDGRNVPRLTVWHPRHLIFNLWSHTWSTAINLGAERVPVVPGDGEWVFYTPFGRNRPWQHGGYRAVKLWWILKQLAANDWARYGEKNGDGAWVAKAPEGANDKQRRDVVAKLKKLGREKAFALPDGWDLKILEATARTWETYQAQIQLANQAIAIALAGQNLTSEVRTGSRAAATVHKEIATAIVGADQEALAECVHEQLLKPYARYNFQTDDAAPFATWDTTPPEDDKARAETLFQFGQALQQFNLAGLPVDAKKLAESMQIPLIAGAPIGLKLDPGPTDPAPDDQATPDQEQPVPKDAPAGTASPEPPNHEPKIQQAAPQRMVRLASGAQVRSASGFVAGQLYADDVADAAGKHASAHMGRMLRELGGIIEKAGSYSDVRQAVLAYYRGRRPAHELAGLVENAMTLAGIGGAAAVRQDVPELKP